MQLPQKQSPDWTTLAGLRFVLALVVMFYHMSLIWQRHHFAVFEAADSLNGMAAVVAFLMISGYSIAHSITREPQNFWRRRLRRIYPTYLLCFAFAFITLCLFAQSESPNWMPRHNVNLAGIVGHLFFAQPFFSQTLLNFSPSWSLGVEVLFYACAPLLLRLPLKFVLTLLLVSATFYILNPYGVMLPDAQGLIAPAALLWAWLTGWVLFHLPLSSSMRVVMVLPPLALLVEPQLLAPNSNLALTGVLPLITALALVGRPREYSISVRQCLHYLGDLSFPLYLVHWPVICALHWTGFLSPFSATCGSFLASAIVLEYSKLFERMHAANFRQQKWRFC